MGTKKITVQMTDDSLRRVVQVVEPEAARLLVEKGGYIAHYEHHGMYYWEYEPWEEQFVIVWPPGTMSAYVSARGQEDTAVIFAVFLLPASTQELHLVYDYRSRSPFDPFEEYFTLRAAREKESLLGPV